VFAAANPSGPAPPICSLLMVVFETDCTAITRALAEVLNVPEVALVPVVDDCPQPDG
jgi:hypothetical protein